MPLELCDIIPGQRLLRALTTEQRTKLLDATCAEPGDRVRSLERLSEVLEKQLCRV